MTELSSSNRYRQPGNNCHRQNQSITNFAQLKLSKFEVLSLKLEYLCPCILWKLMQHPLRSRTPVWVKYCLTEFKLHQHLYMGQFYQFGFLYLSEVNVGMVPYATVELLMVWLYSLSEVFLQRVAIYNIKSNDNRSQNITQNIPENWFCVCRMKQRL